MNNLGYDLISQFNNGNQRAFKLIHELYYDRLVYFAYRLIGIREEAEEITNDTFLKLFQRHEQYRNEENIEAFLYIANRNACFNYLKFQKRQRTHQQDMMYLMKEESDPGPEIVEDSLMEAINDAIENLSPVRKKVFKMIFLQGLKIAEIASELHLSAQTVNNYRYQSLQILKKSLSEKQLVFFGLIYTGHAICAVV